MKLKINIDVKLNDKNSDDYSINYIVGTIIDEITQSISAIGAGQINYEIIKEKNNISEM